MAGVDPLLFPPQHKTNEDAKKAILDVVRRSPENYGYKQSRWSLELIKEKCAGLESITLAGLSQLLKRIGVSYKRGREYVHSPDVDYMEKKAMIDEKLQLTRENPEKYVFLYLDQVTNYRQPTVARGWEEKGSEHQVLAKRSLRSDTSFRIHGVINALTGAVTYIRRNKITLAVIRKFWQTLVEQYPHAETIFVVLDNWPVHFHPDSISCLEEQLSPFPTYLPGNWPTEPTQTSDLNLPIQLLKLPTYASWLNPIEKLWLKMRQEINHLHLQADELNTFKERIDGFFDQYEKGSFDLLHYIGLSLSKV